MDSLLPCTRIGQTMLSLEGSLPKVGRTTLAQEESLFNICVRGLLYNPIFQVFQGKSVLKNSGECELMCMYRVRELYANIQHAHCITSKCAAETGELKCL